MQNRVHYIVDRKWEGYCIWTVTSQLLYRVTMTHKKNKIATNLFTGPYEVLNVVPHNPCPMLKVDRQSQLSSSSKNDFTPCWSRYINESWSWNKKKCCKNIIKTSWRTMATKILLPLIFERTINFCYKFFISYLILEICEYY
jgi:hypothetical protein